MLYSLSSLNCDAFVRHTLDQETTVTHRQTPAHPCSIAFKCVSSEMT